MWQIMLCVAIFSLILEIFVPTFFFLNFAIAGFFCTVLACFVQNISILVGVFSLLSLLLLFVLRPVLLKMQNKIKQKTGMEEKYVGKTAKVVEDIDKTKGTISIYDERWQARNISDNVIPKGATVEIVGYESIIMKVKEI